MAGEDLQGDPVSVTKMRGKVVVINVWWSLCPPCRTEMPELVEASEELGKDAEFVGINIRDNAVESARLFAEQFKVPYPSIYSPDGQALLPFAGTLSPRTIPSTVVLDRQGRIAATVIGPIPSKNTFVDLVEGIAAEPADG
ncbi:TlpA disulfide reductase family protein [Nocardioides rotundus]|uniref:TlpA disulfide reductase family protein n=1 Tax=Nocardioides rotundus TaxID=1774216 RepID=UPI001CBF614B|nr:TlpA disulfide reductase family protein [Nocardioides rotundus]